MKVFLEPFGFWRIPTSHNRESEEYFYSEPSVSIGGSI